MSPNSIIQTLFLSAAALTLRTSPGWAQTPRPPADQWVTNFVHFPSTVATNEVRLKGFETLQTEAVARRLKITWQPERVDTNFNVVVFISTDGIGHWPARDWHAYPMSARGGKWETSVPADSLDTPMVYFLRSASSATTNYSLMRIVRPRIAGLTEPSRPFWPFLEGFEDSIESWHVVAAPD
ncbi:MAG TPA: hypothetical protein VFA77_03100, partial [Candidatus Eisenbacteria bacterium]|nr:hypothetical protein [Candidatus Eisenbacteria bacterium]